VGAAVRYQSKMKTFLEKNKKPIVIISAIVALNVIFGFDIRFTIINLIWLLV
jgi:hypothetical protein